jgi:hypothetical protein
VFAEFQSYLIIVVDFQRIYHHDFEALKDAKLAKITGFIHITQNFTDFFDSWINTDSPDNGIDDNRVQVFMDNTIFLQVMMIQLTLRETFLKVIDEVLGRCGKSNAFGKPLIAFESSFENIESNLKHVTCLATIIM